MTSLKCVNIAIEHFEMFNTTFHYGTLPNAATTGEPVESMDAAKRIWAQEFRTRPKKRAVPKELCQKLQLLEKLVESTDVAKCIWHQ